MGCGRPDRSRTRPSARSTRSSPSGRLGRPVGVQLAQQRIEGPPDRRLGQPRLDQRPRLDRVARHAWGSTPGTPRPRRGRSMSGADEPDHPGPGQREQLPQPGPGRPGGEIAEEPVPPVGRCPRAGPAARRRRAARGRRPGRGCTQGHDGGSGRPRHTPAALPGAPRASRTARPPAAGRARRGRAGQRGRARRRRPGLARPAGSSTAAYFSSKSVQDIAVRSGCDGEQPVVVREPELLLHQRPHVPPEVEARPAGRAAPSISAGPKKRGSGGRSPVQS